MHMGTHECMHSAQPGVSTETEQPTICSGRSQSARDHRQWQPPAETSAQTEAQKTSKSRPSEAEAESDSHRSQERSVSQAAEELQVAAAAAAAEQQAAAAEATGACCYDSHLWAWCFFGQTRMDVCDTNITQDAGLFHSAASVRSVPYGRFTRIHCYRLLAQRNQWREEGKIRGQGWGGSRLKLSCPLHHLSRLFWLPAHKDEVRKIEDVSISTEWAPWRYSAILSFKSFIPRV